MICINKMNNQNIVDFSHTNDDIMWAGLARHVDDVTRAVHSALLLDNEWMVSKEI